MAKEKVYLILDQYKELEAIVNDVVSNHPFLTNDEKWITFISIEGDRIFVSWEGDWQYGSRETGTYTLPIEVLWEENYIEILKHQKEQEEIEKLREAERQKLIKVLEQERGEKELLKKLKLKYEKE